MVQSSHIILLTDNSKKSITYSFRTNVKIIIFENVILKHWKTIYYKLRSGSDYFKVSRRFSRLSGLLKNKSAESAKSAREIVFYLLFKTSSPFK